MLRRGFNVINAIKNLENPKVDAPSKGLHDEETLRNLYKYAAKSTKIRQNRAEFEQKRYFWAYLEQRV